MYLNIKIILSASLISLASTIKDFSSFGKVQSSESSFHLLSSFKMDDLFTEEEAPKLELKKHVRVTSHRFYKKYETKIIKNRVDWIMSKYKDQIRQAAKLTNVPEDLIASFIFIESGGHRKSLNKKSGATGLMQLTEGGCSDILYLKNKQKKLSKAEKTILRNTLGDRLDCILSMQHMGQKRRCNGNVGYNVTTEDLYNPEFNILCGAIYIGILMDRHTENGLLRLDKIVTRYNIGYFTKVKGKTPEEVMLNGNNETRDYIKKLVGRNGVLDIIDI